jgi:hypothetical protein
MDLNPLFVNREISQTGIDPAARVVVVNSIFFDVDSLVGVAAKDAVGPVLARILHSSRRYLRRHAEPACVEPVNEPHERLAFEIELLQLEVE